MVFARFTSLTAACAGSVVASLTFNSLAVAQETSQQAAADDQLAEVVVTANKRAQSLESVPMAITAVSASQLSLAGIDSTTDLSQTVPGLVSETSMNGLTIHLRGVGSTNTNAGTENSVATYLDGVYLATLNGAIMNLASIDQVEVLKGPQGTLFGRNATGGVVSIKTKDPRQEFSGNAEVTYGNYQTATGKFYVTGGLTQNLAADISGFGSYQGSAWGHNLYNGEPVSKDNSAALRSKFLYTPTDVDTLRLAGDYSYMSGSHLNAERNVGTYATNFGPGNTTAAERPDLAAAVASGALAPNAIVGQPFQFQGGFWDMNSYQQPSYYIKGGGVSLQWNHDFEHFSFQSISAYRNTVLNQIWSYKPVPAFRGTAAWHQNEEQYSQELQLTSKPADFVQWVAGAYYMHADSAYPTFPLTGTILAPFSLINFISDQTTDSGAFFGQATIPVINHDTNVTLGLRYTKERRGVTGSTELYIDPDPTPLVVGVTDANKDFSKLTWRVVFDHKLTDDTLGYVSYNRGFKSGVYATVPTGGPGAQPVAPETLDAYEIGLKNELFDHKLRLNLAGFRYDYHQIQVLVATSTSAIPVNGAAARVYGLDMDFDARVTRGLKLSGGLTYLHSRFLSFPNAPFMIPVPLEQGGGNNQIPMDAKGNPLPYAPNFVGNVTAEYDIPIGKAGELQLAGNYNYNSGYFAGPDRILKQQPYEVTNLSLSWALPNGATRVGLWAKNLFQTEYYSFLLAGPNSGGFDEGVPAPPRTFGLSIRQEF